MFFTLTAFTLISGLSPDARKNSYLANFDDSEIVVAESPYVFMSQDDNTMVNFCIIDTGDKLLKNISKYLEEENIHKEVQINTIKVVESLSEFFIDNIDLDSIYPSSYGTVLVDFEKDNNIFSIEIGTKSIGYFSEVESVTYDFCEESFIDDNEKFNLTIGKLNNDFLNFYNRI
jgi:hypothetical protein